jgi:cation diffusion facilitator family transporter
MKARSKPTSDPRCQNFCGVYYGWIAMANSAFNAVFKISVGMVANSQALVASGLQSLTDVVSAIITLMSLRISRRPRDEKHPYGYGKIEFLTSGLFGSVLVAIALILIIRAIATITKGYLAPPLFVAIGPALVAIITNVAVSRYGMCVSRQINSPAIAANARAMTDALVSTGTLIGIVGALVGFPILDSIAAILVSLVVAYIGLRILKDATDGLMDCSAPQPERMSMLRRAARVPGVQSVSLLKTRQIGQLFWVDICIVVPGSVTLYEAELVAREVRGDLMRNFPFLQEAVVYFDHFPEAPPPKPPFWRRMIPKWPRRKAESGSAQ